MDPLVCPDARQADGTLPAEGTQCEEALPDQGLTGEGPPPRAPPTVRCGISVGEGLPGPAEGLQATWNCDLCLPASSVLVMMEGPRGGCTQLPRARLP